MIPTLHNRHHNSAAAGAIYIGRGTPWGNKFEIGKDGTREDVVYKFTCEELPGLDLAPLRGKDLVCSCVLRPWKIGDPKPKFCHGMPILEEIVKRFGPGDEFVRLREENARLRSWNTDLLGEGGFKVNCVYCGKQYGADDGKTPIAMSDVLTAHVQECPDHPMNAWRMRALEAEEKLEKLIEQSRSQFS